MIIKPPGSDPFPDGPEFNKEYELSKLTHDARVRHEALMEGFRLALGKPPEDASDLTRSWNVFKSHVRATIEHLKLVDESLKEGFALPGRRHEALMQETTRQLLSRFAGADKEQLLYILVRLIGTEIVETFNPPPV